MRDLQNSSAPRDLRAARVSKRFLRVLPVPPLKSLFKLTRLLHQAGESSVLEVMNARNALVDGLIRYRVAVGNLQTLRNSLAPPIPCGPASVRGDASERDFRAARVSKRFLRVLPVLPMKSLFDLTVLLYQTGEASVLEVMDARNAPDDGLVRYRVAVGNLQTLTGVF